MWLDEGTTVYFEILQVGKASLDCEQLSILNEMSALGAKLPVHKMRTGREYLHSFAMVFYLQQRYGWVKLARLIEEMLEGTRDSVAYRRVLERDFGLIVGDFEAWMSAELKRKMAI